ncbi:hypothetical protein FWG95_02875 [Candidatus Saccharibacteria bacterium]|nr:hypothetical protein [Candidatus Saccharibacteria bacterium]
MAETVVSTASAGDKPPASTGWDDVLPAAGGGTLSASETFVTDPDLAPDSTLTTGELNERRPSSDKEAAKKEVAGTAMEMADIVNVDEAGRGPDGKFISQDQMDIIGANADQIRDGLEDKEHNLSKTIYEGALAAGLTEDAAQRLAEQARQEFARENATGVEDEAASPEDGSEPEMAEAAEAAEDILDLSVGGDGDAEATPETPAAEIDESQEADGGFRIPNLLDENGKTEDGKNIQDISKGDLTERVDSLMRRAKNEGSPADRIANLMKLGGQVEQARGMINKAREQAEESLANLNKNIEEEKAAAPWTFSLSPDKEKQLKDLKSRIKDLNDKSEFLSDAGIVIDWERRIANHDQVFAERTRAKGQTEQQTRAEARQIGGAVLAGQESRQAQRLGNLANMSYDEIYQRVLESKTSGRTRIIGPINRLTARWQANRIAKDTAKAGGQGDLLVGNSDERAVAREAAERRIKADMSDQRAENRRSAAASRATSRFSQFS